MQPNNQVLNLGFRPYNDSMVLSVCCICVDIGMGVGLALIWSNLVEASKCMQIFAVLVFGWLNNLVTKVALPLGCLRCHIRKTTRD